MEPSDVSGITDARLGDANDAVGHCFADPHRTVGVDLEGVQVALIDADQACTGSKRASQFLLVMDLDECREPERAGERHELGELAVAQRGDDQQHRVGTHHAGVIEITERNGEVLSQNGQRNGGPSGSQVGDAAAEERLIGKDRQAGSQATSGVVAGEASAGSRSSA